MPALTSAAISAIVAGIGAAVGGTASGVGAGLSASKARTMATEEAAEVRKETEEERKLTREIKGREQSLQALGFLAQERQQAVGLGRQRSFARDSVKALRNISQGGGLQTTTQQPQQPTPSLQPQPRGI